MSYNLGVIGIGHWFFRLREGMVNTDEIQLLNVASAGGLERHRDHLLRLGVPESNYYQISGHDPIPDRFFDGVDIVHISDPNEFHALQTLQSLRNGKIAIIEKTIGINREEFENVLNYIIANNIESRSYLHLHYAHKLLTMQLPELLKKFTKDYGKIKSTSATFFEKELPDTRKRRLWLFEPKNGGLFMDWIHPFETYYKGALAERMDLMDFDSYVLNSEYSTVNPTGIHAKVALAGMFFAENAMSDIRIAVGLKEGAETKSMRFIFEQGQCLDLSFVNSEIEYTTSNRGSWALHERPGGRIIESDSPTGPTASDVLINDILELCSGRNPGFTSKDIKLIYEPQWRYQEMSRAKKLIADPEKVKEFINEGLNIPQNQKVLE